MLRSYQAPTGRRPAKRPNCRPLTVEERAVPSAPGVGRTRHPVSGAVQQPRLLYGNLLQTRQLATFRSLCSARNTISEWVRETLLTAAEPSPAEQTIVAELLALRMILMNILFTIANREQLTSTAMDDTIKRADAGKLAKAMERLTSATTGPQRG